MAVNRRPSKERLNLDPGLSGKTNFDRNNHLKLFLNVSQTKLKGRTGECRSVKGLFWEPDGGSNFVKFRKLRCGHEGKRESVQIEREAAGGRGRSLLRLSQVAGEDLPEAQIHTQIHAP